MRNDVANAAICDGGENEPRILGAVPTESAVYPSHKTTLLSRRRGVLPQPALATAIRGSPFLFLLTVEFLIYDSSHQFSKKKKIPFLGNLFQRRFSRFRKSRCLFVGIPCCITSTIMSRIARTILTA
jgi:hypothetical protein